MANSQCLDEHGVVQWRFDRFVYNVLWAILFTQTSPTLAGTVLGIALIVTFVISIAAVVQKNHVTFGLVLLNYVLILDALGIIVIGTFVWWFTLKERFYYRGLWAGASVATRIALQDQVDPFFPSADSCADILCSHSSSVVDTLMVVT